MASTEGCLDQQYKKIRSITNKTTTNEEGGNQNESEDVTPIIHRKHLSFVAIRNIPEIAQT